MATTKTPKVHQEKNLEDSSVTSITETNDHIVIICFSAHLVY